MVDLSIVIFLAAFNHPIQGGLSHDFLGFSTCFIHPKWVVVYWISLAHRMLKSWDKKSGDVEILEIMQKNCQKYQL